MRALLAALVLALAGCPVEEAPPDAGLTRAEACDQIEGAIDARLRDCGNPPDVAAKSADIFRRHCCGGTDPTTACDQPATVDPAECLAVLQSQAPSSCAVR